MTSISLRWRIAILFSALVLGIASLLAYSLLKGSWQGETQRLAVVVLCAPTFAAFLAGLFLGESLSRSLRGLSKQAQQLASGDHTGSYETRGPGELKELSRAIHALARRLYDRIGDLQVESSRLSSVMEHIRDGLILVDADGQITFANAAAEALFELPEGEGAGKTLAQALRYHQFVELWRAYQSSGEEQETIIDLLHPPRTLQAFVTRFDPGSGNAMLLFRDLTQLRRLETVRRDFVSNLSHELRTPLASLKALTETLDQGALNDPPAAKHFLSRIEEEVDSLNQMASELLELSRIESGQVPLELRATAPCAVFEQAANRLRLQAERANLTMEMECPAELPQIRADAARLEQVFVNLIHNAIKFTPGGGRIELSARLNGEHVEFQVRDSGIGIPPEALPRIFERFYKSDRSRASGGTGLGLSIARHLVEAHGGRIWAESVEGQGSTFRLTIPVWRG